MTAVGVRASGPADAWHADLAARATGLLRTFNAAGVLTSADVHVAQRLGRLGGEEDERVLLAVALVVRALRAGSTCLDLGGAAATEWDESVDRSALTWPDPGGWYAACRASPLVGSDGHPLRLVGDLLYLDRYWRQERLIRDELRRRAAAPPPDVDLERLRAALAAVFGPVPRVVSGAEGAVESGGPDHQRLAAAAVVTGWLTVVAGGPGTGKTTTVARLLDVLDRTLGAQRVALAAPTGRAAARLSDAVAGRPGTAATTLHRLLGRRPGSTSRFRHDRHHRLPYDVVVVDETSMVSLTLMARLLDAVRPAARVVLVGDPDQLASVEAGAVLGDLVARPVRAVGDPRERALLDVAPGDLEPRAAALAELRTDVVRLRRRHRFGGAIADLAEAVRTGDADAAVDVLTRGAPGVELVTASVEGVPTGLRALRADVVATGRAVRAAALSGDDAGALRHLQVHRLLCGHRQGPYGVARWAREVERWLVADDPAYAGDGEWYRGRPLLVTANDHELGLYNGDAGVVVDDGEGGVVAAFSAGSRGPVRWATSRLGAVETVHAMTVHKSQGSQFGRVSVLLPPADSPLLTRELLYTAVTRAESAVRVIGTADAVRAAVRRPVSRASGLRQPDASG